MFIKDSKRFNIYASQEIDGVRYANFTDPALREQLGILEIPDPVPPEDYTEDTYYRTEQDTEPFVVFTKKSDEQIAQQTQAKLNQQSLSYLAETDWYVTRFAETGTPIPEDVKQLRQQARDAIVK